MEVSGTGTEWPMPQDMEENAQLRHRLTSATRGTYVNLANLDGLSDAMLAHVSTMKHLTSINLNSSSGFSAEGIKHLYSLPRLEMLYIAHTNVSDDALEGIGSLVCLKILVLGHTKVTDAGLQHLTDLPSLKALGLSGCKGVTSAGVVHVGRLTGLERLVLDGTAVTDDGLQQLTALTNLRTLYTPEGGRLDNEAAGRRIGR
ncbi:unnamed protein product [Closterium sp. Yama58-4]|nr:unnamed protein product [Closterium sp. Yama58-4]